MKNIVLMSLISIGFIALAADVPLSISAMPSTAAAATPTLEKSRGRALLQKTTEPALIDLVNKLYDEGVNVLALALFQEIPNTIGKRRFTELDEIKSLVKSIRNLNAFSPIKEYEELTAIVPDWATPTARLNVSEFSPLRAAILTGRARVVRYLLEKGADMNAVPAAKDGSAKCGWSAFFYAANVGDEDIIKEFIKAGADVNQKTECCNVTPLQTAVSNGNLSTVRALLDAGAEINVIDIRGNSPLEVAIRKARVSPEKFNPIVAELKKPRAEYF